MSELKPCPFCGAENTDVGFIAHTDGCYLMRRYIGASSRKELGIAWNTRPIEDALRAELEKRTVELHYANTACMEMKHELDRLNAERRWIPVSERLPDYGVIVLVVYAGNRVGEAFRQPHMKPIVGWGEWSASSVTHWMPLPPAPESEGE